MADPYDLDRFVKAQDPIFARVRQELQRGRKRSHWMWFIFPQLQGLGSSPRARYYALASADEARAFLRHATLGPRLIECTALVNAVVSRSAHEIFGHPDDLKFHSSMTLFALAQPGEPVFLEALKKYYAGALDSITAERLTNASNNSSAR